MSQEKSQVAPAQAEQKQQHHNKTATPKSLAVSPVTSLGDHSYKRDLEDDYINNKFQLKVKSVSSKAATLNFKGTLDIEKNHFSDEFKFFFPANNRFFQLGVRKNKDIRFHVDFGLHECSKHHLSYVPFFNWKTNTSFDLGVQRFGVVTEKGKCHSINRIEHNDGDFSWTNRTLSSKGDKFKFANAFTFNLLGLKFTKLDWLVGFKHDKVDLFFRNVQASGENKLFNFHTSAVYKINKDWSAALDVNFNKKKVKAIELGVNGKVHKQVHAKLKANSKKKDISAALKFHHHNQLWTAGAKYNLEEEELSFGAQLELNI